MARANRGEMIFGSPELKAKFLEIVQRARKIFRFAVFNFCIMGNHMHSILDPREGENLSKIMQWILSVYAMYYNRKFGFKGHVFYDRFKSVIMYDFLEFVRTFIYIMENPVRAGLAEKAEDYFYSGINFMKRAGTTM